MAERNILAWAVANGGQVLILVGGLYFGYQQFSSWDKARTIAENERQGQLEERLRPLSDLGQIKERLAAIETQVRPFDLTRSDVTRLGAAQAEMARQLGEITPEIRAQAEHDKAHDRQLDEHAAQLRDLMNWRAQINQERNR